MAKNPFNKSNEYHEDLDRIMQYVEMNVQRQGVKHKIQDEKQLLLLIDQLPKGSRGDITPQFADALLRKGQPHRFIGRTIGKFGTLQPIRTGKGERYLPKQQTPLYPTRVAYYKQAGKSVYRTKQEDTFAFRVTVHTKRGKEFERYKDVNTGKFLRKDVVSEEL